MKELVELKNKIIIGTLIDFVPITEKELNNIVELRNQDKNRYFLNQQYILDYDSQLNWYKEYVERDTDIYWAIFNKNKNFIGTVRLYDIDLKNKQCEQGSFMIDSKFSIEAPYAVEAELLSLNFAFYELEMNKVINQDRVDNKVMNNLSKKIGFNFVDNTIIHDIKYNYYILYREDYEKNKEKLEKLIKLWSVR